MNGATINLMDPFSVVSTAFMCVPQVGQKNLLAVVGVL